MVLDGLRAGGLPLEGRAFRETGGSRPRRSARRNVSSAFGGCKVVAEFARRSRKTVANPVIKPLSEREIEVLRLIAQSASNREIASSLFLAEGPIKNHVTNILGKLEAATVPWPPQS